MPCRLLVLLALCLICGWSAGCDSTPPIAKPGPGTPAGTNTTAKSIAVNSAQQDSPIRFVERTKTSDIDFTYQNDEKSGHAAILESLGGGVGLFDYDGDRELDLVAPGGGYFGPNDTLPGFPTALYRGMGQWKFTAVSAPSRIDQPQYYSHGVAIGDWNADGFDDVLVTGFGGLQFWINQGDGTFVESANELGLTDTLWSSSAAWADFNRDGNLDLYVTHYTDWSLKNNPFCAGPKPELRETCSPRMFKGLPDTCYYSNGDGTFRDVSREIGLREDGKGLGVLTGDVDLDGDVDIYVANDTVPNFLYINDGTGKFEEAGQFRGVALGDMATADGSMGVALGDYNLDGRPDLWVANFERESFALYRNEGDGFFLHVSQPTGVTAVGAMFVGFGTTFLDLDLDGDEDLWVANGHVILYPVNAPVKQVPLVFENLNSKRFRNIAPQVGEYSATPHLGRGLAKADIDHDGDWDLAVGHTNAPLAVLENVTETKNRSLRVRLISRSANRNAVGARLTLETSAGSRWREITGGGSYLSHCEHTVAWGCPPDVTLKSLLIRWPNGLEQTVSDIQPGQSLTIVEPESRGAP